MPEKILPPLPLSSLTSLSASVLPYLPPHVWKSFPPLYLWHTHLFSIHLQENGNQRRVVLRSLSQASCSRRNDICLLGVLSLFLWARAGKCLLFPLILTGWSPLMSDKPPLTHTRRRTHCPTLKRNDVFTVCTFTKPLHLGCRLNPSVQSGWFWYWL